MIDFEILVGTIGIIAGIVAIIYLTITSRSIKRDIEPDPERVRKFVESAPPLRRRNEDGAQKTGEREDDPN